MKRLLIIVGSFVLIASLAMPLLAHGPGWNSGDHMRGFWGSGPEYCYGYERGYRNLTQEQQGQLEQLDRKFYDETESLRNEIWTKSAELIALLRVPNANSENVRALRRQISDLRAKLDEQQLSYELEARKIIHGTRLARANCDDELVP
jgi:Spy/CpxP family protein refolding chaperone